MKNTFKIPFRPLLACLVAGVVCLFTSITPKARAQTVATYTANMISGPILFVNLASNLPAAQYVQIPIRAGKVLAISPEFYGGDTSNNNTMGLQFGIVYKQSTRTTTVTPIKKTSTANGRTVVRDWYILQPSDLGPGDKVYLATVTNHLNNIGTTATGSVILSNCWAQWGN